MLDGGESDSDSNGGLDPRLHSAHNHNVSFWWVFLSISIDPCLDFKIQIGEQTRRCVCAWSRGQLLAGAQAPVRVLVVRWRGSSEGLE